MKQIINNKKASGLNTEIIVGVIAIIIVALVGYFSYNFSSDSKLQFYEMAPELTYQFPAVFIHSYLMTPLTDEEKGELSLNKEESYFVKDLVLFATDESEKMLEKKRKEFVEEFAEGTDSPLSYYEKFSKNSFNQEKLLCYFTETKQSQSLEDNIVANNYIFYMKNLESEYGYVRFYCG